jgi:hypothetical protein
MPQVIALLERICGAAVEGGEESARGCTWKLASRDCAYCFVLFQLLYLLIALRNRKTNHGN